MLALAGLFPPPVSLSSGHCTVLSRGEPKWGPFRGIFRYFHGRMEWIFISHFSFFIAVQTQFWTTHRNACSDTHRRTYTHTHTKHTSALPSLTQTSESSAFQLPAISSIFSQQTGSHYKRLAVISHRGSSKHCNTRCKGNVLKISKGHLQFLKKIWDGNLNEFPTLELVSASKIVLAKNLFHYPALINQGKLISLDFLKMLAWCSKFL